MKQLFKRSIALSLLISLVLGLFVGVSFPAATAATTEPETDIDGNPIVNLMEDMNPSFDTVPTIPGWSTMYGVSQSDLHLYGEGGLWSLMLSDSSKTEAIWSMSDKNAIEAGKEYVLSAQVYGGAGEMSVYFYDKDGNELTDLAVTLTSTAANEWQSLSHTFTATDAASLAVKVSSTVEGTDSVWFDSVVLETKVDDSFVLTLPNGDLNAAWNGSVVPGWNFNASKEAISAYDKGNGDLAVALDTSKASNYQFSSDRFPVQPGLPYTATIQIKQTAVMSGQLYIQFYADEKSTAVLKSKYVTFDGEGCADDWATVAVNEMAPMNAKYARVMVASPWAGAGTTYLDNATISYATELVNPSYESEINQSRGGPMGVAYDHKVVAVSSVAAHTGKQSLLTANGTFWDTFRILAKGGEIYEATAWVRTQTPQAAGSNTAILLYFYDEEGKEIKKQQVNVTPTSSWTEMKVSCAAPDNAVAVKAMVYKTSGNGKVFFDDISITQTTDYNLPKNAMENGGFESRTIEKSSPIPCIDGISSSVANLLALKYVDDEYGYAARIYNTNYAQTLTELIPVTPGETYSFTIETKGEGRLQAFLRYYKNDTDKHTAYMKDASGADMGKFNTTSNLSDDEWTEVAISSSVAPEGAAYARIWICGIWDTDTNKVDLVYDNLCFFNGVPKIKIPGETGVLRNPNFEEFDKKGVLSDWYAYGTPVHTVMDATTNPDEVFEGRYALKVTDYKEVSGSKGIRSGKFPVVEGMTYRFSGYVMENYADGFGFQMVIRYFDKYDNRIANFYVNTPATGEWNYCDVSGAAPTGAVSAYVMLLSGGGTGECCFDKLEFTALDSSEYAPVMEDLEWNLAYDEYPRIYFSQERLEEMQRFTKSKSVCAYGYAGTVALKSLLTSADVFLKETSMRITYAKGVAIEYPMYPVLEDPSMRPEWEIPPEGYSVYPYFTAYGQNMVKRMETLALAYALTGEVKYGERAKQYALDICNFEWWIGYYHTVVQEGHVEWSSQPSGYMLDCVMMAYDMCHDLFSKDELALMEANILEELENQYHDCWPRMSKDRDMDHATGMILGACLIMREDNIDQLKKYLDMGMTYINWRLNYNLKSGVNEGHSYDSLAIDDIVVTMSTMERVTGYSGPMDHPFMDELEKTIVGLYDPVNGELPAYSDSNYSSHYYPYTAAILSERGNELATYYLAIGGGLSSAYDKLVWFTDVNIADLKTPDEREGNVTYVAAQGYGALRTGWDILDSHLTINTNNSQKDHNHYDQNSLQLSFNGTWILSDSEYKDNSMSPLTYWQMKYTNTTIFVDGKPQVRKGQGTLKQVFSTHIYGYLLGSAPDAYGMEDKQQVLNQFDRHVIMINHDSQPYYVIIDELDSNKERNFGWNFYTNGWDRLEIDGQHVTEGESKSGQRVVISRFGSTLHSYFVGEQVTTREVFFSGYGPTMVLESEKKSNHQFMNILSTQKGSGSQISMLFEQLMTAQSSTVEKNDVEGQINWDTRRTDTTKNSILSVSIGTRLVMFRAGEIGDWISFPFEVPKTKEYRVSVDVGQTMTYSGTWNLYIDDQLITTYKPNGPSGIINIDAGYMTLEAGEHRVKVVLADTPETAFGGTICSVGGITLDTGESMGEGLVKVVEEYNEGDLLGATVTYGPVLKDVVLFNRGTNEIIGGGLATNGQQASVIGVNGDEIAEGYAVTKGTSLKYGSQLLMTAEGPVSIAMDYTMAKYPVKNDDSEDPVEVHEDFDIENPIYYVSASAAEATKVSVNVGVHAPYTVMIGDQVIESTHSGEMLTFILPAGDSQITIKGTHQHIFDQHATNILNIKDWAGCGHNNVYYVSCVCGENGTDTFSDGEIKGHSLKSIKAVEATDTQDGNIAHFACTKCGKLFADKEGTQELSKADVTILNTAAQTRQQMIITIVAIVAGVLILGGGAVALVVILKKKKAGDTPIE